MGATLLRRGGCALVQLFVFEIQLLPPLREASSSTPRPVPTPAPPSSASSPLGAPSRGGLMRAAAGRRVPATARRPTRSRLAARGDTGVKSRSPSTPSGLCVPTVGGRPPARPGRAGARLDGAVWRPSPGPAGRPQPRSRRSQVSTSKRTLPSAPSQSTNACAAAAEFGGVLGAGRGVGTAPLL